jgi:alkylation response protein AidB-like acyl-CoA dehydrogenase
MSVTADSLVRGRPARRDRDVPVGLAAVRARLRPILEHAAADAAAPENERALRIDTVRALADAGFGAARLPVEAGGSGLTLTEFTTVLIDLGTADSNLPQVWRNHIAFVEDRLWERENGPDRRGSGTWLDRIAAGAVVGGAWSERAGAPGARGSTIVTESLDRTSVSGTKYYSTGSIYADWITVTGRTTGEEDVLVVIDARADGVTLLDDWDGIGQQATGSGTTVLDDVTVAPDGVFRSGGRSPHQEIVYQLVLLAALAGVTAAARDDGAAAVRARVRNYPHGLAAAPRDDAIVQEVIGRVAASAASARAVVLTAARELDDGLAELRREDDGGFASAGPANNPSTNSGDGTATGPADGPAAEAGREGSVAEALQPGVAKALRWAAVATWEAQLVTTDAALQATTELYDALGSSAVERRAGLDRHWRNARTLTSHNPRGYKARLVGDWYLNAADPSPWASRHEAPAPPV